MKNIAKIDPDTLSVSEAFNTLAKISKRKHGANGISAKLLNKFIVFSTHVMSLLNLTLKKG